MSDVQATIAGFLGSLPAGTRLCVAFSGGLDSSVLLHALAAALPAPGRLRAVHVNHGLHPDADAWQARCGRVAAAVGVPFTALRVTVASGTGRGPEAEAREARYQALAAELAEGELLLTAHHADDQLETVLLHLARGSGVAGLAGIPAAAPLGRGRLARPLLALPRAALRAAGEAAGLAWIEDPANADLGLDRNFVRRRVVPVLRERWPSLERAAVRSAAFCAEAADLLEELAALDAASLDAAALDASDQDGRGRADGSRLAVDGLRRLPDARQRNLVRHLARRRGWAIPPEQRLREALRQLLAEPPPRAGRVAWPGGELRRYRGHLYLLDGLPAPLGERGEAPIPWPGEGARRPALELGPGRGRLRLLARAGEGIRADRVPADLAVAFRSGGESFRPAGQAHHRSLKYLYQARGVVPWMRPHVPLLLGAGQILAVADLWVAAVAAAGPGEPGIVVRWEDHGALG